MISLLYNFANVSLLMDVCILQGETFSLCEVVLHTYGQKVEIKDYNWP